jgi:hypothetical protein
MHRAIASFSNSSGTGAPWVQAACELVRQIACPPERKECAMRLIRSLAMAATAGLAMLTSGLVSTDAYACGSCQQGDCVTDWVSNRQCSKEREIDNMSITCPLGEGTTDTISFPPGFGKSKVKNPCTETITYKFRCKDTGSCISKLYSVKTPVNKTQKFLNK